MPHADAESDNLDLHAILDGLDQGILVFDPDDRLVLDNVAARMILGARLVTIRSDGWRAMAALLDAGQNDRPPAGELRSQAMRQIDPDVVCAYPITQPYFIFSPACRQEWRPPAPIGPA